MNNQYLKSRIQEAIDLTESCEAKWLLMKCIGYIEGYEQEIKSVLENSVIIEDIVVDRDYPHYNISGEKENIKIALNKGLNREKTAKDLGMSERTLYRKLKQYNLA